MCGRFANSETIPALAARWSAVITDGAATWEPNTDVHPIVVTAMPITPRRQCRADG